MLYLDCARQEKRAKKSSARRSTPNTLVHAAPSQESPPPPASLNATEVSATVVPDAPTDDPTPSTSAVGSTAGKNSSLNEL